MKIYLSASTQEHNYGVGDYGTEEENMFILRDRVIKFINDGGSSNKFTLYKNSNKKMSLTEIVKDSNSKKVELHLAFHSNAGDKKSRGCEVYHYYKNTGLGRKFANLWYSYVSKVTPTGDRGVKKDNALYKNGLYELRETCADSALMEFFFHDNLKDVEFYKANIDLFALATARAIYQINGLTYINEEAEKLEDWKQIIKKASPKYSDIWISEIEKNYKKTGYNWAGLIQAIKNLK